MNGKIGNDGQLDMLLHLGSLQLSDMNPLRRSLIILLLALWLPATLHCAIGSSDPFDSAVTCCTDGRTTAAGEGHCTVDNCSMLESDLARLAGDDLVVPAPVAFPCLFYRIEIPPETIIVPTVSPKRTPCPPELARTWQFVARAALSPRAP